MKGLSGSSAAAHDSSSSRDATCTTSSPVADDEKTRRGRSETGPTVQTVGGDAANNDENSSAPAVVIDPSKDLWQNITNNVRDLNIDPVETNLLVVGASSSGKTTLLQRLSANTSNGSGSATRKLRPTTALDYSFIRRSERNVQQVVHCWELAQGTDLAQLAEVVLTAENIHTAVLFLVVDASDAGLPVLWEMATYWLRRVERRVSEIAQRMRSKGSSTPDKMVARAQRMMGKDHPDVPRMRISGVPTVLVVNKMDRCSANTARQRRLVRTMRFLAHLYGAYLIFTSEKESKSWRALATHVLFQAPLDARMVQMDAERGVVLVTPDKDSFAVIGDPDVLSSSERADALAAAEAAATANTVSDAELDRWKLPFDAAFPPVTSSVADKEMSESFLSRLYDMSEGGFGEPTIDALRKQKDEELEQYKRSVKQRDTK